MAVLPQLVVVEVRDLERETALDRRVLVRSGKKWHWLYNGSSTNGNGTIINFIKEFALVIPKGHPALYGR